MLTFAVTRPLRPSTPQPEACPHVDVLGEPHDDRLRLQPVERWWHCGVLGKERLSALPTGLLQLVELHPAAADAAAGGENRRLPERGAASALLEGEQMLAQNVHRFREPRSIHIE